MPVPRRRTSKSRRNRRRSHIGIKAVTTTPSHRVDPDTGEYKGRPYRKPKVTTG